MSETRDLLIEIGTEELPPDSLIKLSSDFAGGIKEGLLRNNLSQKDIKWFATPRRIAVIVSGLVTRQSDISSIRRGPAISAAFDDKGNPTSAAIGFAKSCGVEINKLETQKTEKGEWLSYTVNAKGKNTKDLIPEITNHVLSKLYLPKRMRWGNNKIEFVRPVHWTVILFGSDLVDCKILGITANRFTYGHRFHSPEKIRLTKPAEYEQKLEKSGKVIVDFQRRKKLISDQVNNAAKKCKGQALIDTALLDEVAALVEWPTAITGSFDKRFLKLPAEVLIATMQDHQKYFPVINKSEKLINSFITISNIESADPDIIRKGNERVIRPRLSDAEFFWQRDTRKPLADFHKELNHVIYQQKLGTLANKTERITTLVSQIADQLAIDAVNLKQAAYLSKCDLLTDMVGEFPELQGTMGKYYALHGGEHAEVASALAEQYMPRQAGAQLPESTCGQILSIADKLDSLIGFFGIGQQPSGDKDPFGLRRAALSVLRIMIECKLDIDLEYCLQQGNKNFTGHDINKNVTREVFDFMMERLRQYYIDRDVRPDVFEAVLECRPTCPFDFDQRINAVTAFTKLPEAESLAAANKRIQNILRQAGYKISETIDGSALKEDAEISLKEQLGKVTMKTSPLTAKKEYTKALNELSRLRDPVDKFFDHVMVMVDDETLRLTRLHLLATIQHEFKQIADISRLQG